MNYDDIEVVLVPDAIKNIIAEYFNKDVEYFLSEGQTMEKVFMRHLCRYFMCKYCGLANKVISRLTMGSDHSIVCHSIKTIEGWLDVRDSKTESAVAGITQLLIIKYGYSLVKNAAETSEKRRSAINKKSNYQLI